MAVFFLLKSWRKHWNRNGKTETRSGRIWWTKIRSHFAVRTLNCFKYLNSVTDTKGDKHQKIIYFSVDSLNLNNPEARSVVSSRVALFVVYWGLSSFCGPCAGEGAGALYDGTPVKRLTNTPDLKHYLPATSLACDKNKDLIEKQKTYFQRIQRFHRPKRQRFTVITSAWPVRDALFETNWFVPCVTDLLIWWEHTLKVLLSMNLVRINSLGLFLK